MSSLYNLLILSLLLSYGLCHLPLSLWRAQDHQYSLYDTLERRAHAVRGEYRQALVEFYLVVS